MGTVTEVSDGCMVNEAIWPNMYDLATSNLQMITVPRLLYRVYRDADQCPTTGCPGNSPQ